MKKILFIIMLIFFIIIDGYTTLLVLGDMIIPTTTIEVTSQSEDIVEKIKEHFNINYEIKKIKYKRSFPDGYILVIYDSDGVEYRYFEDRFKYFDNSEIDAYFQKLNIDTPKYLNVLILEIIIEIAIIVVFIRKNKIKQRNQKLQVSSD